MYVFMGGTFDPVHRGHLAAALQVRKLLKCNRVHLMPTRSPVHKAQPTTTTAQRLEMLMLATMGCDELAVELREIHSQRPCYTIDTLRDMRKELGELESIVMIIGMDSYHNLPSWQDSQDLLTQCHILVLQRPGYDSECSSAEYLPWQGCVTDEWQRLTQSPAGQVFFFEQAPQALSSTQIRALEEIHLLEKYVPQNVANYINENQLYG